jgi:hypothetical protein
MPRSERSMMEGGVRSGTGGPIMLGGREGAGRGREQKAGAEGHRDVSVPLPDSSNARAAVQDGDASTIFCLLWPVALE